MKLFIDIVMKRIYLFNIVAWNYRKKIRFPVCKKENFTGLQAHRKRGKNARASPTPHHTLNEERSARFTAQPLSALLTNTHTARGFFVLYHVFITLKQCILCSVLRHKSYLTLPCVNRFKIFSALELSCKALFGCRLAPSRLRRGKLPLLISNSTSVGSLTSPSIWLMKGHSPTLPANDAINKI